MSCKCKNIIENFQGGTVPLDTTFLQNVDVLGNIYSGGTNLLDIFSTTSSGSTVTIGNDSGCTSGNTVLVVSGGSIFECDVDIMGETTTSTLNITNLPQSSGSTGTTISSIGVDGSGNVVRQEYIYDILLGPADLIGAVPGTEYFRIGIPIGKYVKVEVHNIFTPGSVAYDGTFQFNFTTPGIPGTGWYLPTNLLPDATRNVFLFGPPMAETEFGVWMNSFGAAPTMGDSTIKFRLSCEYFDI